MDLTPNTLFANRYILLCQLGLGGYSEVWKAEDQMSENMIVALKIFAPGKGLDQDGIKIFSREYSAVFNFYHHSLLKASHYDICNGSPYLVLSYCKNGSALKLIGEFNENGIARFMKQSASALAYLHSQDPPVIHQDVKPDNFLIDNNGNYLLADFGISSKIRRTLTRSMGEKISAGTLAYMPPEKFSREKIIIAEGDIFSLGVCLYELLKGELPFGEHGGMVMNSGAEIPDLPSDFSQGLNTIVRSCMAIDPSDRPTAKELENVAANFLKTGVWQTVKVPESKTVEKTEAKSKGRETAAMPINLYSGITSTIQSSQSHMPNLPSIPAAGKKRPWLKWLIVSGVLAVIFGLVAFIVFTISQSTEEKNTNDNMKSDLTTTSNSKTDNIEFEFNYPTVYVEAGIFSMGCTSEQEGNCDADEEPTHEVSQSSYNIGKYEVTQKQWSSVMSQNASYNKGCDDCPVENVSWNDIQIFIGKLNQLTGKNYRLPTEVEWEYAARGGKKSLGYLYSGSNNIDEVAWIKSNSNRSTHPIGQKRPNELGIYDMSGNVYEWCNDWYKGYEGSIGINDYTGSRKVLRGGCWGTDSQYCRVSNRNGDSFTYPGNRTDDFGFRLIFIP